MRWFDSSYVSIVMPARIDRSSVREASVRIGETLRAQRQTLEMSQTELAGLTKVPQPEISRVESGRHNPTVQTVEVLAHALGLELQLVSRNKSEK